MVSHAAVKRWAGAWRALFPPLIAGGLAPLSLSPVNVWPLALVSVAILYVLLDRSNPRQAARTGWLYGLGFFGVGVSWVFVSINVYGNVSGFLAGLLTLLLVAGLALLFALQCWLYRRYFDGAWRVLSFAALWVVLEWFRGWFLTGFPWLYLGYAHIHTALGGLAPVFGVLAISFVVALSGAFLGYLGVNLHQRQGRIPLQPLGLIGLALLWLVPAVLRTVDWVTPTGTTVTVAVVQANIDQNLKFDPNFVDQSLGIYERLSEPLWEQDIVVWSETSIPLLYHRAGPELTYFDRLASRTGSALVTGIFYREDSGRIYNSVTSLGAGEGIYHKQKLVPFGEYVPFINLFSGLLRIFDLPMSSLSPGPSGQSPLHAAGYSLAPFICYEIVYPDFVRRQAIATDFLVTISNDTWFGASFGPLQHLQMAAMRALENGKYLVRSTSNGVSAIVDEKGRILKQSEQFKAQTLSGTVRTFEGRTPFSRWGSWPVLAFMVLALLASGRRNSRP